jgi:hypothetical protein
MKRGLATAWGAALAPLLLASAAAAVHSSWGPLGYNDLLARLGGSTPTGMGVEVVQVEVGAVGNYGPDQGDSHFVGKNFIEMSGRAGSTSHATTVGRFQYGNTWSIAPGVEDVYLFSAAHWVGDGFLRTGQGTKTPLETPGAAKLMNHSWIGAIGTVSQDNDCLRRADLVVGRDQVIMTVGVNNDGGPSQPLLSHMFNGISVGVRDGTHTATDTEAPYDGPGRQKPEIVGAEDFSSYATPMVDATAAILVEAARTDPALESNPNAERADVLKSAILAGAVHEDLHDGEWSNNAVESGASRGITMTPIDDVVGVGLVNVDRSHLILTGAEQDGMTTVPDAPTITWRGWDSAPVAIGASSYYRFQLVRPANEISILATWNRAVRLQPPSSYTLGAFDLYLWSVDAQGDLATLVGDAGLGAFSGGNVVSASAVDNIEHIFVRDLVPGSYVIELRRLDSIPTAPTWNVGISWLMPEPSVVPGDVDGDGIVGFLDLLAVLSQWGPCPGCPADLDGDGTVGFLDLLIVLSNWSE